VSGLLTNAAQKFFRSEFFFSWRANAFSTKRKLLSSFEDFLF
jgi:hypothetical protein